MATRGAILGLDSTGPACSAAVLAEGGNVLGHTFQPVSRGHAEVLMPVVTATMAAAGLDFSALAGLAVSVGPGSFTGVRAGLAAARGLALASGLPLVGVSSFEAIALGVPGPRSEPLLLVVLDTKRRDFYAEAYGSAGEIVLRGAVRRPEELHAVLPQGAVLVAGDATEPASMALNEAGRLVRTVQIPAVDAIHVAALGAKRLGRDRQTRMPEPLYLRAAEASLPADGGRLRS